MPLPGQDVVSALCECMTADKLSRITCVDNIDSMLDQLMKKERVGLQQALPEPHTKYRGLFGTLQPSNAISGQCEG